MPLSKAATCGPKVLLLGAQWLHHALNIFASYDQHREAVGLQCFRCCNIRLRVAPRTFKHECHSSHRLFPRRCASKLEEKGAAIEQAVHEPAYAVRQVELAGTQPPNLAQLFRRKSGTLQHLESIPHPSCEESDYLVRQSEDMELSGLLGIFSGKYIALPRHKIYPVSMRSRYSRMLRDLRECRAASITQYDNPWLCISRPKLGSSHLPRPMDRTQRAWEVMRRASDRGA